MTPRPLLRCGLAAGLACALLVGAAPTAPAWVTTPSGRTALILAHRGDGADAPENSVEAYQAAAAAGYDGIETDIQFSSDHQPVMSHSDTLRQGNPGGSDCVLPGHESDVVKIHKTSWAQLSLVRCLDRRTGTYSVPLATFAQLSDLLAANPGLALTLDLKKYSGASANSQRDYAERAAQLLIGAGLVTRTRILTYNWDAMLSTLRRLLPTTYVLAYDHSDFSYDRVRLAAKLGASGYGVEARYTSANLAAFIRAKGMDVVPWNLSGTPDTNQSLAFWLYYGPKAAWFLTDDPSGQRTSIASGATKLDWLATPTTTPVTPATIDAASYSAGRYRYPVVLGKAIPATDRFALQTVTVRITTKGAKKRTFAYLAAKGADASSRVKVSLKRTGSVKVAVPVGDGGRISVRVTKKARLTVRVIAETRVVFS